MAQFIGDGHRGRREAADVTDELEQPVDLVTPTAHQLADGGRTDTPRAGHRHGPDLHDPAERSEDLACQHALRNVRACHHSRTDPMSAVCNRHAMLLTFPTQSTTAFQGPSARP